MSNTKKNKNQKRVWYPQNFALKTFFQAYQNAINAKKISFEYPFFESRLVHEFLKCLVKESRISGYQFVKEKQKVHIFLSYDFAQKAPLNPQFVFYSSSARTKISSLKTLQHFQKQYPTSLALITFQGGIMTLKDCLQQKCGGQLLVTMT